MSNLSNLMISGSYKGLINLEDSTQNLASQSGDVELQDGLGDNIGLRINATTKEFTIVNNFKVDGNSDFNGNVDISGSLTHTGSIDIVGDLTIQGDITANVGNFDTVNARLLNITEESASVIFSSGSNVLGDEETDRQDLIGQVIVSGTLGVEGDSAFTGSLTVSNEISSSTINGIGNVTTYSSSVDNRIATLPTTGSNIFDGSQEITGSVNGNVENVSIVSNTASFDCSLGNFFTLTLPSGSTQFQASNITPGQTISIKVDLGSNTTNVTTDSSLLFPNLSPYSPTQLSGSVDLLSFVSFDASELLGASILRLV